MNDQNEFLTTKEAAQIMRLSPKRIAAMCDSGAIKARRTNGDSGHWRIPRKQFMQRIGLIENEPTTEPKADDIDLDVFKKIRQAIKSRAAS